jgi:hypothetical protein
VQRVHRIAAIVPVRYEINDDFLHVGGSYLARFTG